MGRSGEGRTTLATLWRLPLLLVLAAGFWLRLHRAGYQELRGDETFGYFFILDPFGEIVRKTLDLGEPHPVASYFLQRLWLALSGDSELALRFISIAFGLLSVALLWHLARWLGFTRGRAWLAATMMAISPYTIWHSQDARMYSISLALTLASTLLALRSYESGQMRDGAAYILVSLFALHTHYFSAFILLVQNLFVASHVALSWRREGRDVAEERGSILSGGRGHLRYWILLQSVLLLAYAPWLWVAREILAGYGGNGDSPGFLQMLVRSLSVFGVGESVPPGERPGYAIVAGLLLLGGFLRLVLGGREERWIAWLLLLYLAVPIGTTWWSALDRPIFNERYLIAASPPFFLLIAATMGRGRERGVRGAAASRARPWRPAGGRLLSYLLPVLLLLLLLSGMESSLHRYYYHPEYDKVVGWRELVAELERLASGLPPDEVRVAQNYPDPTYWYYYDGAAEGAVLPPAANDLEGARDVARTLVEEGVRRVLIALQPAPEWDGSDIAATALSEYYSLVDERPVGPWPLRIYARPPVGEMEAVGAVFVNGVRLESAVLEPDDGERVAEGGVVVVHLEWGGDASMLSGSEKVFIHLIGSDPAPVAQSDPILTGDLLGGGPRSHGLRLPDRLPPGEYRVVVGLYDPAAPGAARVPLVAGGDSVTIGEVSVSGWPWEGETQ